MRIDTGTQPLASSTAQPPTTPLDSSGSGVVIPFNAPASGTSSFEQVLNAARAAAPSATSQTAPMTGQTAPLTGQLATTAPPLTTTSGQTAGGSTTLSGLVPPLGANAPTGTAGSSGASSLPSTSGALPGMSGMSGSGCCCCVSAMATSATPAMGASATSAVGGATATQPAPASATAGASSALSLPFQGKYDVTQPFGPSPFVFEPAYNGYDHFHTGIDYGLPLGTTVAAAGAGRVVEAGWDSSGFGNHVVIDHGNGVRTLYGHLERIDVTVGQQLQPGQEIGLSGSTGNSSGPHLHFGVEKDGKWVDPTPYLNATTATTAAPSLAYSALGASLPPVTSPSPGLSGMSGAMTGMTTAGVGGASASTGTAGTTNLQAMIRQVAQNTGVPAALLSGVVQAESSGDAHAVSSAGAKGLMQLTDATAASMGVTDVFDPMQNLMGGAKFLRSLLQRYHGDEQLALAAYNAGPGAVDRYGGIPPFGETQQYVKRVTQYERNYSGVW